MLSSAPPRVGMAKVFVGEGPSAWRAQFEPHFSTDQLCPKVGWALMPSQGCAGCGSLCPHWVWNVLPSSPLPCVSEKLLSLCTLKLRIFEVSPPSGCAFFDLAMTHMRAGSEATSLLYSQGIGEVCCHPQLTSTKLKLLFCCLLPSFSVVKRRAECNKK